MSGVRKDSQCLAVAPVLKGRCKLRADHIDKGLDHHMHEGEEPDGTAWSFIWTPPCGCEDDHCGECGCCP